ncbi:DNA recombination protein RmuC [Aquella oligotrophica]|uniref:DNA recombination protein RmuC n=1 Tax=Aquella oligotrophica TaxID=2067065 RepID=A0A2I7N838_9NEIS|nr:DNA recombination protein RmuC [Aquella oligotrophica]AUR52628.1 hypothetical protein CUN60_10075 [Aquella oligotrophica]
MESIILIAMLVVILVLVLFMLFRINANASQAQDVEASRTNLALANQELANKDQQLQALALKLEQLATEVAGLKQSERQLLDNKISLSNENVRLKTENDNLKQAYNNLEHLLADLKEQMIKEFGNIKSQALLELQNKASETLGAIGKTNVVEPLSEKLRELDSRIIELRKETHDISNKSNSLSEQANNLAQALTRDSQKKGEFGEMILANILEFAGLKERVSYIEQVHLSNKDISAKNLRADCLINLPDNRGLIIDSKNIVGEYYNAITSGEDREKLIRNSVLTTIKLFASKDYISEMERVSGRNLFDYMIMFIPNEGLFNLIVAMDSKEDERGLLWFAYSQKVIIAGPSTILALLAIIDRMWQSHEVEEKAAEIVKVALQMSDQLRLTLERLTTLGNSINKTAENYNQVVTSFANGSNSSMVGKFIQLSNYKRELDKSQPILSGSITRSLPDVEFDKIN